MADFHTSTIRSTMDVNPHWYAALVALVLALLVIRRIGTLLTPCLPFLRHWTLRATHPLLVSSPRWASVTYVEAAALLIYIAANGLFLFADKPQTSNLMLRCGLMSAVNMIPLFLGGRTSVLADRLGIPFHTYYLAHYWIGGMVIGQALIHALLAISARKAALDRITASGALVGIVCLNCERLTWI